MMKRLVCCIGVFAVALLGACEQNNEVKPVSLDTAPKVLNESGAKAQIE
jgi:hypothetical protein